MSTGDHLKRCLLDQFRAMWPSDPLQVGFSQAFENACRERNDGGLIAASSLCLAKGWLFVRPNNGSYDWLTRRRD